MTDELYEAEFVKGVFAKMAASYGLTNLIASLGFCRRWREACVALASVEPGMVVYDVMSGMGECWHIIHRQLGDRGRLIGLDFSDEMCRRSRAARERIPGLDVSLLREDFLANSIEDRAADCVVSSFGLKTFSPPQLERAAAEIARILKPGGHFSLLEISVPRAPALRLPYMFYIKRIIPLIGAALLGDPSCYRLLGSYTESFGDCRRLEQLLSSNGLDVEFRELFFGCATAVFGRKPM